MAVRWYLPDFFSGFMKVSSHLITRSEDATLVIGIFITPSTSKWEGQQPLLQCRAGKPSLTFTKRGNIDGYVNINWINGNFRIVLKKGVLSYRIHVGHFTMPCWHRVAIWVWAKTMMSPKISLAKTCKKWKHAMNQKRGWSNTKHDQNLWFPWMAV